MPRSQIITMKLILLCLAVVLCTFGKGTAGVRVGGRFGISANANMKSAVGLSPKTKSADGDKHDNVPAGDEATLESKSNIGAGAAIDLNSKLGLESAIKAMASALAKAENSISKSFEKLLGGAMAFARGSGDATAESKQQSSLGVATASGGDQKVQAEPPEADASKMLQTLEAIVNNHRDNAGTSGVSDSQHSSVGVTTGSEGHLNLKDETAPEVNGNEVDGQNSSDSSETGSMNVGNKNDSGTSVASPGPHDSAGSVVSGRCTCSTD